MKAQKIYFLTVGDMSWASSRYRSFWPVQYMDGIGKTITWKPGDNVPMDGDVYVWMKTGSLETMRELRQLGKMQFVEVCDPSWWWQPNETRAIIDEVTAIVAATPAAANDISDWYGDKRVYIIPDRLDLRHYPRKRKHISNDNPVRFIWYGVSANRIALLAASSYLERLKANGVDFSLTICDNQPDHQWALEFPVHYLRWSLNSENMILADHDIALLPPYPGPWGRLKSNNKMLTAWACGLPVTDAQDWGEFYKLATDCNYRIEVAEAGREELETNYQVQKTAYEWIEIIEKEEDIRDNA